MLSQYMKFLDIIFVTAALLISAFLIFRPMGSSPKRLLMMNGEDRVTLPFYDQKLDFKNKIGKDIQVEISNGNVRFLHSNCPDKVCVNSGWATDCGHIIICMPNSFAIMIDCSGALNENK